ncbi:hypothetical protein [Rossellomorea arthrocnemi]|jgi:hypothetical protein|uniref:hypothetical protein n=1 Tax=Rossellomorea arthrocnemi TaxID=2769542 RepID=UPI00191874EB|nr:hypothetical protein [Rossellomorea arthrocnemi]
MYNSLSEPRKRKPAVGYIRVATKEQLVQIHHARVKPLLETKYDYQNLPRVRGLIMEEYLKKF